MTNEEKAKQLYCKYKETNLARESAAFNAAIEMAEWKEEQMTKNVIDFLVKTVPCTDGFIEEFISAMKGE